ncbi:hypothetical protein GYM62_13585 [Algoriphagus sp. NBT04N3]|jgi:hypothetical protein|uniref:hypothetical protein n=1 Tax=Algoriphagus sp. NBT04N3 TaxID=2705473 RepID=UPI001C629907|nr:hypothetical protein [Algoriphagus sp. NBT04N3]QYH39764.1 hypothetical protein GYM62_13585 [Algoriphagus sp. NBT04N3]
MKNLTLTFLLSLLLFHVTTAQKFENPLNGNDLIWADANYPVTDTLAFKLPNEGTLLLLYNHKEYEQETLQLTFEPLLEKATDFPEFTKLTYRLTENYYQTSVSGVIYKIEANYVPYVESLELTFPVGLDFTGGDFTPIVGFRSHLNLRQFSVGGSITNTIYFPERENGNVRVNGNWFAYAEFSWEFGKVQRQRRNTFGVGYLLNQESSQLFSGRTMQAFYKRKLNDNISIRVGVIATENFKTFYPTLGIRFW